MALDVGVGSCLWIVRGIVSGMGGCSEGWGRSVDVVRVVLVVRVSGQYLSSQVDIYE